MRHPLLASFSTLAFLAFVLAQDVSPAPPPGYADGTGTNAAFNAPVGLAFDGISVLYVADSANNVIRGVDASTDAVSTVAGSVPIFGVTRGYADGTATSASFSGPWGLAYDSLTAVLYVADSDNNLIRALDITGQTVSTVAGGGATATAAGYADGTGSNALFAGPSGLAIDTGASILYVAENSSCTIRSVSYASSPASVMTLAGGGGAVPACGYVDDIGTSALFNRPAGLAFDGADSLYVADSDNAAIRVISISSGAVTTFAGSSCAVGIGCAAGYADGSALTAATLAGPSALAYIGPGGAAGTLFFAASNAAQPPSPFASLIRQIDVAGATVSALAGNAAPLAEGYAFGTGTAAVFWAAAGLASDSSTNLFVADASTNLVTEVGIASAANGPLAGGFVASASVSTFSTASETASATSSSSFSSSETPSSSETSSSTASETATSSVTGTTTMTPSSSPSVAASKSISPTVSQTPPTQSSTPSVSPTAGLSVTPTTSVTSSRSSSRSTSVSPSIARSVTRSPSVTRTVTASRTVSRSVTSGLSHSPTRSRSQSRSVTASVSPTRGLSVTPTPSRTASVTPSVAASVSPSASESRTVSLSPSATPSVSSSPSPTRGLSTSPSSSSSPSLSPSPTPSVTASASVAPGSTVVQIVSVIVVNCVDCAAYIDNSTAVVQDSVASALGVPSSWIVVSYTTVALRRARALRDDSSSSASALLAADADGRGGGGGRGLQTQSRVVYSTIVTVPSSATPSQLTSINSGLASVTAATAWAPVTTFFMTSYGVQSSFSSAAAAVNGVACGGAGAPCYVGPPSDSSTAGASSLSGGAIAGIVVGSVVFAALVVTGAVFGTRALRRRRNGGPARAAVVGGGASSSFTWEADNLSSKQRVGDGAGRGGNRARPLDGRAGQQHYHHARVAAGGGGGGRAVSARHDAAYDERARSSPRMSSRDHSRRESGSGHRSRSRDHDRERSSSRDRDYRESNDRDSRRSRSAARY